MSFGHFSQAMMNFKDSVKFSLGLCVGVVVVVHSTKLVLRLANKPKSTMPPGPRPWPIFGNTLHLGPNPAKMLAKVCEEYGGIMTLFVGSIPTVVISSPRIMAEFVAPLITADHFESRPGELIHGGAMNMATNKYCRYINVPTHRCPQWRKVRRILASYLMGNNARAINFRPVRESNRDRVMGALVENLKVEAKAEKCYVVNMRPHLRHGCLDLLYAICFGSVVDVETGLVDQQLTLLLSTFKDVVRLGTTCKFTDYLPIVHEMPTTIVDVELVESAKRAEECCVQTVAEVRNRFTPKDPKRSKLWHSFLDVLTNLKGEEKLSDREITWILSEIMLSAVDHAAAIVEWALGHLCYRNDMQFMIQAEIDRVVGPNKHISDEDMEKMPYLKAVIKETQRVNHPVLLTLPHVITKPFQAGGYTLPTGSHMVAIVSALFTDPSLWIEPHDFRPERFFHDHLHEDVVDQEKDKLRAEVFNAVRRFSPGHGLVTHKSRLFLAKILQSFDVLAAFTGKPRPFDETSSHESGIINSLKVPLQCSLKPRGVARTQPHELFANQPFS